MAPACLVYPALLDNDEVIYGGLMAPNSPAAMRTHVAAVAAEAAWEATQGRKNDWEMWRRFLEYRVAHLGHNLTVTKRMLATFYHDPPRANSGLPVIRSFDGIIIADGNGGIEHYDPYAWCVRPDVFDLGAILQRHRRVHVATATLIDRIIADDAIARAMYHCSWAELNYHALHERPRRAKR